MFLLIKYIFTFYLIQIYFYCSHSSDPLKQAFFSIIPNSVYIPQFSSSFLINWTDSTIINARLCAVKCLGYDKCQTAIYFTEIRVCSLFYEKSTLGQIVSGINQTSSVISMQSREPKICVISSQSTWSKNSTVIFGDPAGNSGISLARLYYPNAMYYDLVKRELIISDMFNYRVIKFSRDKPGGNGKVIAGGNGGGCATNQFNSIYGVVIDSTGQLYVTDGACNWFIKFPPNSNSTVHGQVILTTGGPTAIAIDLRTDDIYVSINTGYVVMKFSKNSSVGIVVAGGNGWGNKLYQLTSVNYLYFDSVSTRSLYVSDSSNRRVLKFGVNSTNNTLGIIVAGNGTYGTTPSQTGNPDGIFVDRNGIVYVADGTGRILRWLPNAITSDVVVGGLYGTPEYVNTQQAVLDENNNMLVLEKYYNRIRLYNIVSC